jgi:hypothetical protein
MGYPRTKSPGASRFNTSINGAVANVTDELRRFGNDTGKRVENVVISSNVTLGVTRPQDSGVAVYLRWDGIDCAVAVDRYAKPEDNLQAIAKVIEAERSKLRHGGLNVVRASFRGYAALPPPKDASGQLAPPWRVVLFGSADVVCTLEDAEAAYRKAVKEHHPDRGGDAAKFNAITDAIRQAREELRA